MSYLSCPSHVLARAVPQSLFRDRGSTLFYAVVYGEGGLFFSTCAEGLEPPIEGNFPPVWVVFFNVEPNHSVVA